MVADHQGGRNQGAVTSAAASGQQKGPLTFSTARKNLLRYRTPTLPIADMRHVVAAIDDRPRHSGGGCTLSKQTPRPAAVASPMGQLRTHVLQRKGRGITRERGRRVRARCGGGWDRECGRWRAWGVA